MWHLSQTTQLAKHRDLAHMGVCLQFIWRQILTDWQLQTTTYNLYPCAIDFSWKNVNLNLKLFTDCFKPDIAPICPIDEATSCVKFWVTNGVHCTNQTKPDFQVCAIAAFLCGLKSFALCILEDDFLLWLFQCWENPVVIHLRWFRVASFIALIGGLNITRPPLTFSICNVVFVELVFQTIPPHKFWRLENGEHKEVYGAHAGKTLKT